MSEHISRTQLETVISKSVQFGSRPLGVHSDKSDFDFAILESDLPDFDYVLVNPKKYFNVLPEHSRLILGYKVNNKKMDILVLKHQKDLDIIKTVMSELCNVPKYLLAQKPIRLDLYEKSLLHYGWTPAENIPDNVLQENEHRQPVTHTFDICTFDIDDDDIPF